MYSIPNYQSVHLQMVSVCDPSSPHTVLDFYVQSQSLAFVSPSGTNDDDLFDCVSTFSSWLRIWLFGSRILPLELHEACQCSILTWTLCNAANARISYGRGKTRESRRCISTIHLLRPGDEYIRIQYIKLLHTG